MSKATKGPWSTVEHSWSRIGIYAGNKGIATLDIYDEATEETEDALGAEMAANAAMMAASLDVYKALNSAMRALGPRLMKDTFGLEWFERAAAALAKARGEAA